ncbi:MAG: NADH-quinone oxidoreductase subunit B [Planctomycetota bacterium]|jgi:NADH-quinone oxidoreductase subunit B
MNALPMANQPQGDGQVYRNEKGEELQNQNKDSLTRNQILITPLDKFVNWARSSSVWPMTFGLACCAIEMMAVGAAKYDLDRFGSGPFRATPRQADLMIVAGTVNHKMAPRVKRLYDQMPEPKYVIAMGACTVGGGPYAKFGYHVLKGVDLIIPVDVHVPGCPPRPEALLEGIFRIQEISRKKESVLNRSREGVRPAIYRPGDEQEPHFARDVELPNIMDRRKPAPA